MKTITYKSKLTVPPPHKRYISKSVVKGKYRYCIMASTGYDIEHGLLDAADLPENIRKKCDKYNGVFYACEFPL
ncbi:MAG: hypothetical protein PHN88_14750 [Ignavibacteria bacterium]|nr:hypothetical protein [Ignavibacteria bacterium]